VPLLLVHGNLSYYRLARLIKYSFYKNITFAFVLFYFQFYNGFGGQALVDSITAAVFNVVFTSFPILLFSILDRPVKNLKALVRYPQVGRGAGAGGMGRQGTGSPLRAWLSNCQRLLPMAPSLPSAPIHSLPSPPPCSCTTSAAPAPSPPCPSGRRACCWAPCTARSASSSPTTRWPPAASTTSQTSTRWAGLPLWRCWGR
jgi:hypothetical protein